MKIGLSLASAVAMSAAVFVGAVGAAPPPDRAPLYSYIYYSDASHTTVVGEHGGVCYGYPGSMYAGVAQFPYGTVTAYVEEVRIGWCLQSGETIYE